MRQIVFDIWSVMAVVGDDGIFMRSASGVFSTQLSVYCIFEKLTIILNNSIISAHVQSGLQLLLMYTVFACYSLVCLYATQKRCRFR